MTPKQQYLSETPKILLTNSITLRWKCMSCYVAAKLTISTISELLARYQSCHRSQIHQNAFVSLKF